ncbi:MAG: hypothetical protein AB7P99_00430 [Vicinamibacterales bacterium]
MKALVSSLLVAAAMAALPTVFADDVVEIRLGGYYYSAPANVRIIVAVEPDPDNRTLLIEADGERMFRSSEMSLTEGDRRLHTVEFKNLAAGTYRLRAAVIGQDNVIAVAEQELVVGR